MAKLTDAAWELLLHIEREAYLGQGARPSKSAERDALQRLGFIRSAPANGTLSRSCIGNTRRWRPTQDGIDAIRRHALSKVDP